jgi:hypothetical protein
MVNKVIISIIIIIHGVIGSNNIFVTIIDGNAHYLIVTIVISGYIVIYNIITYAMIIDDRVIYNSCI